MVCRWTKDNVVTLTVECGSESVKSGTEASDKCNNVGTFSPPSEPSSLTKPNKTT